MGTRRPATPVEHASKQVMAAARLAQASAQPLVRLSRVKKLFGSRVVIDNLSLEIGAGELVEVVGPSGAGKTTLLRLLHGQLRPSGGEVWVDGRRLHRWWRRDLETIRRDVAFIFQDQRLLPRLTALENVVLGLMVNDPYVEHRVIRHRAMGSLAALGIAHRAGAYPPQLSAGEKQRVVVARALANRPRVLLADEPFTSIDRENGQAVARMLEAAAAQGTAVVVATHRPTGRARRVVQLPGGMVTENGRGVMQGWRRLVGRLNGHAVNGRSPNGNTQNHNARNGHIRERRARGSQLTAHWRRLTALFANSFRMVVLGGLRSWRRDLRFNAPALQTMALLLIVCGLLALVGLALGKAAATAEVQASRVRVYIAADATPDQVSALEAKFLADPRVASVRRVSAAEALQEASSRPGLSTLAGLTDTNPFPASLDVSVRLVTEVSAVAQLANGDPAVDPSYPTSYDPDVYNRLRRLAVGIGVVGGALLLVFAFVAYAVAANSMRAIAAARRDEVTTLRLLGARTWMLRDPFVIEGLMTGALAGALAGAVVAGAWMLAQWFAGAAYVQVLPGVGLTAARDVIAAVIVAGMMLGTLTAVFGFRRVRA